MSAGSPVQMNASGLRQAGRMPATPFRVLFDDGSEATLQRLLRVLPGKRIVAEGTWRGRHVLAKLFVGSSSGRHWTRETQGIAALREAGIATPEVVASGQLHGGGRFLLTEFLAGARSLAERWEPLSRRPAGDAEALAALRPAFEILGRMHAAGLIQTDLHLANFLEQKGQIHVIDGDGVQHAAGQGAALDNLALLIAQLPVVWETAQDEFVAAYGAHQEKLRPDAAALAGAVARARAQRLKHFLEKTLRDCSQFAVSRNGSEFVAVVRSEKSGLEGILADPDRALAGGRPLKDGNTCTVARIEADGRPLVIKRYNLKNFGHALSRFWRPSRAWHSWLAGHRLAFYGIATPAPLAMREERFGPLRRRAVLINEFCAGRNLLEHLDPEQPPPPAEAEAIVTLFRTLRRLKLSHGDFKATNLLWHDGQIVVIDLDAMVQHTSESAWRRDWRRDRARFLRNWPAESVLHRWLDANLPPAA